MFSAGRDNEEVAKAGALQAPAAQNAQRLTHTRGWREFFDATSTGAGNASPFRSPRGPAILPTIRGP
jgi:hypothetical protein